MIAPAVDVHPRSPRHRADEAHAPDHVFGGDAHAAVRFWMFWSLPSSGHDQLPPLPLQLVQHAGAARSLTSGVMSQRTPPITHSA